MKHTVATVGSVVASIDAAIREHDTGNIPTDPEFLAWEYDQVALDIVGTTRTARGAKELTRTRYRHGPAHPRYGHTRGVYSGRPMALRIEEVTA